MNGSCKETNEEQNGLESGTVSYQVEKRVNGSSYSDPQCADSGGSEVVDEERGAWGKTLEFLLSCISMSVGLGNVWRFPSVAYKNGGGAFLIPYLIVLLLVGRPLYYLELSLGQFCGQGPVKLWRCVPALKGVGVAQLISTVYIMIFYNYLMAISVYYLFASMQDPLPWTCFHNSSSSEPDCDVNNTLYSGNRTSLSEQYYYNVVVKRSSGLEEMTQVHWWLALCLLFAWILVYGSIIKGVTSVGKVAYFTACFPYVVLIALLIVALLEEGSATGIAYFFQPKWSQLADITVWYEACKQAFFSLNIGFGALVMFSSYNKFRHNVGRDAIIISVMDTFTSLLAGCVIFAVLGTLAHNLGSEVDSVVNVEGNDLAFIAYPEALSKIPYVPQLWSVLFFIMLFTLGIGSSMAQMETILTPLRDEFPVLRKRKWLPSLVMCLFGFLCGLTLTTDAGTDVLGLLDNYGVGTGVFLYGIVEIIGIAWIYGLSNLCVDLEYMNGQAVGIFWKVVWGFVTIVTLVVIFVYGNVEVASDAGKETVRVPAWGSGLGWALAGVAIVQIPGWMIWAIVSAPGITFCQKFQAAFSPLKSWGPKNPNDYVGWLVFKRERQGQGQMDDCRDNPPAYENVVFEEDDKTN